MRPRTRGQQHQDGRLYLRKNDHRDVIYNNNYHNIVYAEQIPMPDDPETLQTGRLWVKYPKMEIVSSISSDRNQFAVDVKRQFIYNQDGFGMTGQRSGGFRRLRDIWLEGSYFIGDNDAYLYNTADGITFGGGLRVKYIGNRYGANGLIEMSGDYTKTYRIKRFSEDENGELVLDADITFSDGIYSNFYTFYLCPTNNGALFLTYTSDDQRIFEIKNDGEIVTKEYTGSNNITSIQQVAWSRKGSFTAVAFVYSTSGWHFHTAVWTSSDDWSTINKQGMIELDYDAEVSGDYIRLRLTERNGWFYLYGSVYGNRSIGYKSDTGISWTTINLPIYIDIPTIDTGNYVSAASPEYYRLVIDSSQYSDSYEYTVTMWSCILTEEHFCFIDGKHATIRDYTETEYLFLKSGGTCFFFDNMIFLATDDSFSFLLSASGTQTDTPDTLIEGDYCLGGNTVQNI